MVPIQGGGHVTMVATQKWKWKYSDCTIVHPGLPACSLQENAGEVSNTWLKGNPGTPWQCAGPLCQHDINILEGTPMKLVGHPPRGPDLASCIFFPFPDCERAPVRTAIFKPCNAQSASGIGLDWWVVVRSQWRGPKYFRAPCTLLTLILGLLLDGAPQQFLWHDIMKAKGLGQCSGMSHTVAYTY